MLSLALASSLFAGITPGWQGRVVYPLSARFVAPCGPAHALVGGAGVRSVALDGTSDPPEFAAWDVVAAAHRGSTAWFVLYAKDRPYRLARFDCAGEVPRATSETIERISPKLGDIQLKLAGDAPWLLYSSLDVPSLFNTSSLVRPLPGGRDREIATSELYASDFGALVLSEPGAPWPTLRLLHLDGRSTALDPTCDVPDGVDEARDPPFETHVTSDATIWSLRKRDVDGHALVEACVRPSPYTTRRFRSWALPAGADIEIPVVRPIDRTSAAIYDAATNPAQDTPSTLLLLDTERDEPRALALIAARFDDTSFFVRADTGEVQVLDAGPDGLRIESLTRGTATPGGLDLALLPAMKQRWRDGDDTWAVALDGIFSFTSGAASTRFAPCPGSEIAAVVPTAGGGWGACTATSHPTGFGFHHLSASAPSTHPAARLEIGDVVLDSAAPGPAQLPCSALAQRARLALKTPWIAEPGNDATIRVELLDPSGAPIAESVFRPDLDADGASRHDVFLDDRACVPGPGYALRVRFTNALGSGFEYTWPDLALVAGWWESGLRTTLTFGGLLALLTLLWLFASGLPSWLRGAGHVASLLAGVAAPFALGMPWPAFAYLPRHGAGLVLGAWLLALVAAFVVRGGVWRLADVPPYRGAVALALRFAPLRRRHLAGVVAAVRARAELDLRGHGGADYLPLPARIHDATGTALRDTPAERLRGTLRAGRRDRILVLGDGGTGKSTLLRHLILGACDDFEVGVAPRLPLLVRLPRAAAPHPAMLRAFARDTLIDLGVPRISADDALARGDLVLFVDGLSEGPLHGDELGPGLDALGDLGLVATARPYPKIRDAFAARDATLVELLPLDDADVDRLADHYRPAHTLTPALKHLLRGAGGYRPLLVVLALADGDDVADIGDLFTRCFRRMAGDAASDPLLLGALGLCLATYWADGKRTIVVAPPWDDLVARLLRATLLVPVVAGGSLVRWFHDSMQSYLTAFALQRDLAVQPGRRRLALLEAAGHPRFGALGAGSELYQACVTVFERERLREDLIASLDAVADSRGFDEAGQKRAVFAALPAALAERLRVDARGQGAAEVLRAAIAGTRDDLPALARLFGELAPAVIDDLAPSLPSRAGDPPRAPEAALAELLLDLFADGDAARRFVDAWPEAHGVTAELPGGTASASAVLHALVLELGRRGQVGEFCERLAAARPLRRHELEAVRRRLAPP